MYVKVTNGSAEIYTIGQLRRDNPNTSFPRKIPDATLASYNVYPYTRADQPDFDDRTQKLDAGSITEVDGAWVEGWTVADKTADEITAYDDDVAEGVRNKRNELLAETDYLALSDSTLSTEMATYRQALRDITSQDGFPLDVTYPTKP